MLWLPTLLIASAATKPIADVQSPSYQPDSEGAFWINEDCIDMTYDTTVITSGTNEVLPIIHRRVSGFFNRTDADFDFYLPTPAESMYYIRPSARIWNPSNIFRSRSGKRVSCGAPMQRRLDKSRLTRENGTIFASFKRCLDFIEYGNP